MSGSRSSGGVALGVLEAPKSEMLRRLERQEITIEQYLDHCAEEAVAHIKGLVDSDRLQFIKAMIRDQMRTDPVLVRYIEQATGLSPEVGKAS
jgi:hypothetical protein